jgi:hypothetical protein
MFRPLKGFKAEYQNLTVLVAADFDEYRILLQAPGVLVHGKRQFTEAQAKDHAFSLTASYLKEKQPETAPPAGLEWVPFAGGEWLAWHP